MGDREIQNLANAVEVFKGVVERVVQTFWELGQLYLLWDYPVTTA